jgi:hypothetical protein
MMRTSEEQRRLWIGREVVLNEDDPYCDWEKGQRATVISIEIINDCKLVLHLEYGRQRRAVFVTNISLVE